MAILRDFQLQHDAVDEIVWKHTDNVHYSAESAYKAHLLGMIRSSMEHTG